MSTIESTTPGAVWTATRDTAMVLHGPLPLVLVGVGSVAH